MLTWALVNVLLTALALSFALMNRNSPHRLRFHVCFIAMLAWLVPWSLVPAWMPALLSFDLWRMEQGLITSTAMATTFPLILIDTRALPLANDMTVLHLPLLLLASLLLSGLAMFLWHLITHHLRLRRLARDAQDASHLWQQAGIDSLIPILLQHDIRGAFSSGLLRPKIWVYRELANAPQLFTLLQHELTHIQQHDNWYLLPITLVEKLFWWNPLLRLLGQHTRHLQELSCDERCRDRNADYTAHLAALMLADAGINRSPAQEPLSLGANIFNKPKLNIQRLKALQRSHCMKPRHIVSSITTAVLAIVSVGLVTAQDQPQTATTGQIMVIRQGAVEAGSTVQMQGSTSTATLPGAPGERFHTSLGMRSMGDLDQFMKVDKIGDETRVSFSFTDAALPMVLGPLANMLGNPMLPTLAVAAAPGAVPMGPQIRIMRMEGQPPSGAASAGGDVLYSTPATQSVELRADAVDIVQGADGQPMSFAVVKALSADPAELPLAPNLVIKADNAHGRLVTVSGDNVSLAEALEAISNAANCDIFEEGDTVVIDWCAAQ